jgi:signal transduction histidine kinase
MHLKDISLNYKIPLRVAVLVFVTASILTSVLVYRSNRDLREIMIDNAGSIASVIADNLVQPILHDDVWRAFEIINTPFHLTHDKDKDKALGAEYILVLDPANKVFISTKSLEFPILSDPLTFEPNFSRLLNPPGVLDNPTPAVIEASKSDSFFLAVAIRSDGVRLGTLIMSYSKEPFRQRFYTLTRAAILITLLVLIVLLPIGVYWGKRMAAPLLQLSDTMSKITVELPDSDQIQLEESKDEIGQLAKSFKNMLGELKEKEQLQQQVIASDRLAAIGRMAAGVAHEINNPLCGMINAISTYKRHGDQDPMAMRTLSILERGLVHIKETVAALLVEAKAQNRPFDLNDVSDICTLVQSNIEKNHVNFTREIDIIEAQPISSTLVRQVIINLLLNAFQATQPHGHVHLHIYRDSEHLFIDVINDGSYIPQDQVSYLFEPFTSLKEGGSGLGLWVIYQVVQQLGGLITVQSEPDKTQFSVQLPLEKPPE